MVFQYSEMFLLLLFIIPIIILFVLVLNWKQKVKRKLGDTELIESLTNDYSHKNYRLKFYLLFFVCILCIVAAANLRKPMQGNTGDRKGIDVMVALDVSNSMLAQDIKPNRLERARQVISKLIDKMGNNRMGLVLFAGQAFLQMPITGDLAAAKMYVSNANPDAVPNQGTVIGDALRLCNSSLDNKEKKFKAVVLISDGEDHDETAQKAVEELQQNGVVVFTVGLGSSQGAPIYEPATKSYKRDENGVVVMSKLNEADLKEIAQKTNGQYIYFTTADNAADKLYNMIDNMEKKNIGGSGIKIYQSYFQWFLLLAFILLIFELIIPENKMKWFVWSK